jgi:hypothetical protein
MKFTHIVTAIAASATLAGCATSPKTFYENPAKQDVTALCRAFGETKDAQFQQDLAVELTKRGMTAEACIAKIQQQNAAIAAVALVGTVAAVGVVAANGGGYSAPSYGPAMDKDCYGGKGDGPLWQYGPIYVGGYDPHGLDADNDGTGCEASDVAYGS